MGRAGRGPGALCRRRCATNADGGCDVEDRDLQMRCCAGDGGRPSGTALQGEVSNHRKLLRLRAVVVSVAEKAHVMRQVGAGKANVSEPLRKASKAYWRHQNRGPVVAPGRAWRVPAYWPGGDRREGGASPVQASARNVGTCRPDGAGQVLGWPAEGSPPSSRNCEGPSTGAGHRGGPSRSSGEAR